MTFMLRPVIALSSDSSASEKNMPGIEQNVGVRNVFITALLDALCGEGVHEVEISKALTTTGVSRAVFNEQFRSKDGLLSAFLRDRHAVWMRWFENEIETRYEGTGGGLEIIADVLQEGFEDPKCFGFAFVNIATESRSPNREPLAIARKQKEHLQRFIEQLAARMGLQYPDMAASATVFVIDRAILRIQVTGSLKEVETACLLFQCLQHA